MRSRKLQTTSSIDFDSGETTTDSLAEMRQIEKKLGSIKNSYVGNKRKILTDIAKNLDAEGIKFDTMLDLFSGSAVISIFFKMLGKQVTSNDLLTSSYYNAVAFVSNNDVALSNEEIDYLCNNNNPGRGDFVQRRFSERFTEKESLFLDNYRANIDSLLSGGPMSTERAIKKALAFVTIEHYVMDRCYLGGRLNNGQILAKLKHRLDHNRNKTFLGTGEMTFKLPPLPLFSSSGHHTALNMDADELLFVGADCDLVYIDPPYGASQSDYAEMFRFCEEYVHSLPLEEVPNFIHAKKFATKKEYETHFRSLLLKCGSHPYWAISYNNDSFTDLDGIVSIVSDYRKNVKAITLDYDYKYRKPGQTKGLEYLIIAR